MPEYLSPGVYVEEFETGGRPLAGVSTSTVGFIGVAEKGETEGLPELVTSFADFQRKFGGYLSENVFGDKRYLAFAVDHFFTNGGSRCFIMRVAPDDAKNAECDAKLKVLKLESKNKGEWGNKIIITIQPEESSKGKSLIKEIIGDGEYQLKDSGGFNCGDIVICDKKKNEYHKVTKVSENIIALDSKLSEAVANDSLCTCEFKMTITYLNEVEIYNNLSLNPLASNYVVNAISRSNLVKFKGIEVSGEIKHPIEILGGEESKNLVITFGKGTNGTLQNVDFVGNEDVPGKRTGIQAFIDNDDVSIMCIPGNVDPNVQLELVAHCENMKNRFAILDVPKDNKKYSDVTDYRNKFETSYAAMYHPWLQVYDKIEKKSIMIPPSGSIAGIYARSDISRGVHKAPANEVLRATTGLDCQYNTGEQDMLNPRGVNLIRYFSGQGIKVWGARTCTSNTLWKYVNIRRLFIYLEESIRRGTQWVVFEPNDEKLWARVNRTITSFLTAVWRDGALVGTIPQEAFYVKIDRSTMTQADIDNGKLICEIGVSPVKPAEFVIFRIAQYTGNAE